MPRWKDLKRFCDRDGGDVTRSRIIIFTEKFYPMGKSYIQKSQWEAARYIPICGSKFETGSSR